MFCEFEIAVYLSLREIICSSKEFTPLRILNLNYDFLEVTVFCVFSLESPHRGDYNWYTQYTIFNMKKKITLNYLKFAANGFFQGTQ